MSEINEEIDDETAVIAAKAVAGAVGCHDAADCIARGDCDCLGCARAALEAALPMVVEQRIADAYQIVANLADAFGVHDHPEVVRAMDWLAYGKTADGSDILPWPRAPLTPGGSCAAIRARKQERDT